MKTRLNISFFSQFMSFPLYREPRAKSKAETEANFFFLLQDPGSLIRHMDNRISLNSELLNEPTKVAAA